MRTIAIALLLIVSVGISPCCQGSLTPSSTHVWGEKGARGFEFQLEGGLIKLNFFPNFTNSSLFVEMTYAGTGWLGFGFTGNGKVAGSTAVIGVPNSGRPPELYHITGSIPRASILRHDPRAVSGVYPLPPDQQTLRRATLTQNETHTVMSFTKNLVDPGMVEITRSSINEFTYAYGVSNVVGFHLGRAIVRVNLSKLSAGLDVSGGALLYPLRSLWLAHGVLMCLAWGILIPLAIGSSLLRRLLPFPEGAWFKIHYYMNAFAFACLIAGFALAVRGVSLQNDDHFEEFHHRRIGLAIFVASFVQVASGLLRPHNNHKHLPDSDGHSADKAERGLDDLTETEHAESVKEMVKEIAVQSTKSMARLLWEYQHRILGACLVGLAWYNCDVGLLLFSQRYGHNTTYIFWVMVGGLAGSIFIVFAFFVKLREKILPTGL